MGEIEYRVLKQVTPEDVAAMAELYRENRWIGPEDSAEFIAKGMLDAAVAVAAYSDGKLIGMGRALSDGVSDAYLQDIAVSTAFRRRGIGGGIVRTLVAELRRNGVDWIALVGEPGTESFYRELGFKPEPACTFWKLPPDKVFRHYPAPAPCRSGSR